MRYKLLHKVLPSFGADNCYELIMVKSLLDIIPMKGKWWKKPLLSFVIWVYKDKPKVL